jgi:hypothetical protein
MDVIPVKEMHLKLPREISLPSLGSDNAFSSVYISETIIRGKKRSTGLYWEARGFMM